MGTMTNWHLFGNPNSLGFYRLESSFILFIFILLIGIMFASGDLFPQPHNDSSSCRKSVEVSLDRDVDGRGAERLLLITTADSDLTPIVRPSTEVALRYVVLPLATLRSRSATPHFPAETRPHPPADLGKRAVFGDN